MIIGALLVAVIITASLFLYNINSVYSTEISKLSQDVEVEKSKAEQLQNEKVEIINQKNEVQKKVKIVENQKKKEEEQKQIIEKEVEEKNKEIEEKSKEVQEKDDKIKNIESEKSNLEKKVKDLSKKKELEKQQVVASANRSSISRNTTSTGNTSSGKVFNGEATAYGATRLNGGAGSGKTATGATPIQGRTIAVDRRLVPLGSKVRVTCPGYPSVNGVYIAEDVGGAIKGNRIDIYFNDLTIDKHVARKSILNFGRRKVQFEILK